MTSLPHLVTLDCPSTSQTPRLPQPEKRHPTLALRGCPEGLRDENAQNSSFLMFLGCKQREALHGAELARVPVAWYTEAVCGVLQSEGGDTRSWRKKRKGAGTRAWTSGSSVRTDLGCMTHGFSPGLLLRGWHGAVGGWCIVCSSTASR